MYPILAFLLPPSVPLFKGKLFYLLINTIVYAFAWLTVFIMPPLGMLLYVISVFHAFSVISDGKREELMREVRRVSRGV